jgi:hypothetical protein
MSPLLGSTGLVSYYSYRGNIDTLPDVFSIGANVTDVEISAEITRTVASVTGINYKAKVTPSSGATISVNGSGYTSTAQYVRNGQSVSIKYTPADYETDYTVSLTIGKRSASYTIRTRQRPENGIPNAFDFNQPSGEIDPPFKTNIESNIVTLSGMSNVSSRQTPRKYDYGTASISGNGAQFKVTRLSNGWTDAEIANAVERGYSSSSYQVLNGDQIQLRMNAGGNAQTVSTTFSVTGTDTTNLASPTTATVSDTWSLTSKNYVASISLSASPTTVGYDNSSTISWNSENIQLPIVISDIGNMYSTLGSRSTGNLKAGAGGGSKTFTASANTLYSPPSSVSNAVTVNINPPPAPIVTSFTADSYSLSFNLGTTTLRWSTSEASSINSNFGETVANGYKTVGPLTQTTTYTISANGLEGQTSSTSSLTITVPEEPAIEKHITSNTTNVNASSYFGGDWGRNVRKKLYIDPGVVVGSTDPTTAALIISSGVVGAFTLINNGSIQGAPGTAGAANGGNGGKGGNAIRADASATIENYGSVVAGGGGGGGGTQGGSGGNGGSGSYTTSTYVSQSCPSYDPQCPTWFSNCTNSNLDLTTRNIFCVLYYAGCPSYYDCSYYTYSEPIATTGGTGGDGGNGGAGGIGQGYNQGSTVGSSGLIGADGSVGGTNAGNGGHGAYGGNGGNGGNYGLAGSPGNQGGTGNSGTSGNVSGGTGGQAASASVGQGGASGYSLNGTNYTSLGGYFEGPQKSNP